MSDKIFDWNYEKNQLLIRDRKISFEEVIHYIENGEILSNIDHPNQNKFFLKTIIPSRKAIQEGLPYQTLISSLIHKYVTGKIKEVKMVG